MQNCNVDVQFMLEKVSDFQDTLATHIIDLCTHLFIAIGFFQFLKSRW